MPLTLAEISQPRNPELVELLLTKGAKRTWRRPVQPPKQPAAPTAGFEKDGKQFSTFEFDVGPAGHESGKSQEFDTGSAGQGFTTVLPSKAGGQGVDTGSAGQEFETGSTSQEFDTGSAGQDFDTATAGQEFDTATAVGAAVRDSAGQDFDTGS
jgi:hypothetical protein